MLKALAVFVLALVHAPVLAAIHLGPKSWEHVGQAVLWLIGWAIILAVLWWALAASKLGDPWAMILRVLLIILTVVVVINFVATVFFGSPLVTFG